MRSENALLFAGTVLLSVSALLGFVQHQARERPDRVALWRVVHVGGTAGAVQLIALGATWTRFGAQRAAMPLALGLILATWAFFVGPLARALGLARLGRILLAAGAAVAIPVYIALPVRLFLAPVASLSSGSATPAAPPSLRQ